MTDDELFEQLFENILSECKTIDDEVNVLENLQLENKDELRRIYCNSLLFAIPKGDMEYSQTFFKTNELVKIYLRVAKTLPKEYTYYHMISCFFEKNNEKCLLLLNSLIKELYEAVKSEIKTFEVFLDEELLVDLFFEKFKQAFEGFWKHLAKILRLYPVQDGLPELCEIIDEYFTCKTNEEALNVLLDALQKHPNLILVKELIGYTYYLMNMWNNAIAYFESVEEQSVFYYKEDLCFMIAWCYGKIKNHKLEEAYYRKVLEITSNDINSLNNLGYCLYQQKKYIDAMPYFEKCFEIDADYKYAKNNYVRVLIALGRNKDAKDFVRSNKNKIAKDLVERVKNLENKNARIKNSSIHTLELSTEETVHKRTIDLGVKRQQFSNEKLLEDELTARIESGRETFGLNLKIYKRKGVYGRQYIIPIGRLDLLCEDDSGNLYVIELKKDSGYDDAYKQTTSYLEWFENDKEFKDKKVFGIICVNSPTQELIDKVHKDKRMKLFEYSISFREM